MATKTQIKNYIKDRVYTNTRQAITGNSLQETLCRVVDDLELGSSTGGVEKNYVDSQDKMTLDEAKKYTDAKVAGGGEALLTWRYSTVASKDAPLDPDKAPNLWHAAPQTADDHWAALKETGGKWTIWPITAIDGSDGRGIRDTDTTYVLSDQGVNPPQSGWSESIPEIVEGKYLWSRTITTYTDNTQDTIYTVTYIGRDGNDGKNGKSVNIKGSLASINDLPTSPTPSENDGYIIGEDLWVYTGTSLDNDKNHNGFTNVGKVSVKGDSACLHIAWANTLAPDYENFTTQKPKGQRYRYMGTYVDYSENPSTHPDSQRPEDYNWQEVIGEQGESVIVADLDNEIESIALTYDGKTTAAASYTPIASMWYGSQKLTLDSLTAVVTKTDFANNVVVVPNKATGAISISWQKGVELTSFNVDITVKATVNETQYVKLLFFKVNCVKAGEPGADSVLYKIEPSTNAIKKFSDGSISDLTISCKKIKVVGSKKEETTDGTLYYKIDSNDRQVYTGAIDTSTISRKIRFEFEVNDILWDAEDIYVIEDGSTPKIVDTKYSYAITMNHVIPSDESWTEPEHLEDSTPIEGLPGQYLWTKIIYTWSDGTVTYSISYARCGFNGKDGKTKPSVVTYKGVWKSDGLYTGTETDDSIIVDIVYFTSAGAVDGKYYMAIQTKKFVNESTPQPDTDEGKAYWSAFQGQYANIATDFLFSQQVVSNLIQAININATKINADKINTDDLVARKVRTAETGERITIQDNRFEAKDGNNKIVTIIDPSKTIDYNYYSTNSYELEVNSGSTFFTRRTTQTTANSITNVYTVGTFVIGPSGQYLYDLLCNNLIIRASSSSNAAGTYPQMPSVNNFSVTVNAKIGSRNYTLASGSVQINGPVYQVKQVPLIFNKTGNLYYAGTTGCTISISVTHSYSQPSSYSAYINQANVSFDAGATFGVYVNPSVFIGKNMASFGTLTESNHCLIGGSGNTVLDILTSNSGITVTQDSVNVITDKVRGLAPIVNPYVYTHSGIISSSNTNYSVDIDVIETMYALHKNSVPVYCNVTCNYVPVSNAVYTVNVMAKLEAVMAESSSTTGYMDTTLFFVANLHDMRQGYFNSETDHIINIFITGKTRTDNGLPPNSSGSLKYYIHTI